MPNEQDKLRLIHKYTFTGPERDVSHANYENHVCWFSLQFNWWNVNLYCIEETKKHQPVSAVILNSVYWGKKNVWLMLMEKTHHSTKHELTELGHNADNFKMSSDWCPPLSQFQNYIHGVEEHPDVCLFICLGWLLLKAISVKQDGIICERRLVCSTVIWATLLIFVLPSHSWVSSNLRTVPPDVAGL